MFFQPPETEKTEAEPTLPTNSGKSSGALKSARRKRRKKSEKYKIKKQVLKKEKQRFANTMSSWAENFTMAATWQLKHQVAHWKSKARALEYENNILRDVLRQYYVKGNASVSKSDSVNERTEAMSVQSDTDESVDEKSESEDSDEDADGENIEISEEFIEFLKGNAEFRKQRQERERLRKLEEEMPLRKLEACPESPSDMIKDYKNLYGANWQKIAALEMSMQSQFISDCDKDKPLLWPNIPIRL